MCSVAALLWFNDSILLYLLNSLYTGIFGMAVSTLNGNPDKALPVPDPRLFDFVLEYWVFTPNCNQSVSFDVKFNRADALFCPVASI